MLQADHCAMLLSAGKRDHGFPERHTCNHLRFFTTVVDLVLEYSSEMNPEESEIGSNDFIRFHLTTLWNLFSNSETFRWRCSEEKWLQTLSKVSRSLFVHLLSEEQLKWRDHQRRRWKSKRLLFRCEVISPPSIFERWTFCSPLSECSMAFRRDFELARRDLSAEPFNSLKMFCYVFQNQLKIVVKVHVYFDNRFYENT